MSFEQTYSVGKPCSTKSGISSAIARGLMTAPESMWSPTSALFSITSTVGGSIFLRPFPALAFQASISCIRWSAEARVAGPAPT